MQYEDADAPEGVELYDPEDYTTVRRRIFDRAFEELKRTFPMQQNGLTLSARDLRYEDPEHVSMEEQRKALLGDKFLARRIRGTLELRDAAGTLVQEKPDVTLMRVPYYTDRGTFIHNGSEYTVKKQLRLMPGIFARQRRNGELETQVQPRADTGVPFRVALEPDTGQLRFRVGGSNLHLYSLLKDVGIPDEQMSKMWGPKVLDENRKRYDSRVFGKAYKKLVLRRNQDATDDAEKQRQKIREALDSSMVHRKVILHTMPTLVTKSATWSATRVLEKLAGVKKIDDLPFAPDFSPDQLTDVYNAIYGKHGPQLASMKEWPSRWFPPGSDEMGWLQWYENYHAGRRSTDDARQIQRWKRMKVRTLAAYLANPTPRRAFALRNWGIDAPKHLQDEDLQQASRRAMEEYKTREWRRWEVKKAAFSSGDFKRVAEFLNKELNAGLDTSLPSDALAEQILRYIERMDPQSAGLALTEFSDMANAQAQQAQDLPSFSPSKPPEPVATPEPPQTLVLEAP